MRGVSASSTAYRVPLIAPRSVGSRDTGVATALELSDAAATFFSGVTGDAIGVAAADGARGRACRTTHRLSIERVIRPQTLLDLT